jgi:hypothetical protein
MNAPANAAPTRISGRSDAVPDAPGPAAYAPAFAPRAAAAAAAAPRKRSRAPLFVLLLVLLLGGASALVVAVGKSFAPQPAAAAVPTGLIEELALIGPKDKIKHDLERWRESLATTLLVSGDAALLRTAAELVLE